MPVLDESGRVTAVAGSSRDITQHMIAEEMIQLDRRRWRELLLRAPAAIALFAGPEHDFAWLNPECVRLLGRSSRDALLGKPISQALPELKTQGYVALLDTVFLSGQPRAAQEACLSVGAASCAMSMRILFACRRLMNKTA